VANLLNSLSDPQCPTYASGTMSLTTNKTVLGASGEFNNDGWCNVPGINYGGFNQSDYGRTVNAKNDAWTNDCLTQSIQPTYSSGILSFGRTGRQS
jgi:hypothetical protein